MPTQVELERFARIAAPLLAGTAAMHYGARAARERAGAGLEFLDNRPYVAGDDVRRIDWRQSARSRELVLRRYRDENASDWMLCVDRSASMAVGDGKWPLVTDLACALAYTLLAAGNRVGLMSFSDRVDGSTDPGRGVQHYAALVAALRGRPPKAGHAASAAGGSRRGRGLSLLRSRTPDETAGTTSNPGACRGLLPGNCNVVVIGDFLAEDAMRDGLRALRSRAASVRAIQVLDPDETKSPATGPAVLVDAESRRESRAVLGREAASAAAARLARHRVELHALCAGLGIRLTSATADRPWQRVLLEHLRPAA